MRTIECLLVLYILSCAMGCSGTGAQDPVDMASMPVESECANALDDDGDGQTDCADPDCAAELCVMGRVAICQDAQCSGGELGDLECADAFDNDRDGLADCDDPDCAATSACADGPMPDQACDYLGSSAGVCASGLLESATERCLPPVGYQTDEFVCDGRDNDCDGVTDEGCACLYQELPNGRCLFAAVDDSGTCTAPVGFQSEETSCDGYDNDCDGDTDEGCQTCAYTGSMTGVCAFGIVGSTSLECAPPASY